MTKIPIHDRRKVSAGAQASVPPPDTTASDEADDAAENFLRAQEQAATYLDDLQRLKAEFDNYRKRTMKEQSRLIEIASAGLVARLVTVLDHFDNALASSVDSVDSASILEGISIVQSELSEVLKSEGLESIGAEGDAFDPNIHEAVLVDPGENEGDPVVEEVLRRGYLFKGALLRPAMVKVGHKQTNESEGMGL